MNPPTCFECSGPLGDTPHQAISSAAASER